MSVKIFVFYTIQLTALAQLYSVKDENKIFTDILYLTLEVYLGIPDGEEVANGMELA